MRIWGDTRCSKVFSIFDLRFSIWKSKAKNPSVADPAAQLQRLYLAGFDLQTFDRFPKCVGVVRDDCIALLVPTPEGLQMLGTPGWRMGEAIGVLVERDGRLVFQAKQEVVEATADRLETLRRFRAEVEELLAARG
jgi:hypothetical protein